MMDSKILSLAQSINSFVALILFALNLFSSRKHAKIANPQSLSIDTIYLIEFCISSLFT